MVIKKQVHIFIAIFVLYSFFYACIRQTTIKDPDENMLDLKICQENMGDMIKQGRLQDAKWLPVSKWNGCPLIMKWRKR